MQEFELLEILELIVYLHIDLDYTVRPFEEVEEEYLSLFEKFSSI